MGGVSRRNQRHELTETIQNTADVHNNAGWVEWDISAFVPANAFEVLVGIAPEAAGFTGVRQPGSALNRTNAVGAGQQFNMNCNVIGQKIEIYDGALTHTYYSIYGYYG